MWSAVYCGGCRCSAGGGEVEEEVVHSLSEIEYRAVESRLIPKLMNRSVAAIRSSVLTTLAHAKYLESRCWIHSLSFEGGFGEVKEGFGI